MPAPFALLACLILAGCGGDDGVSAQQWAERADAICIDARDRLEQFEPPGELAEVPAYVEQTLPIAREELRALSALEAPDGQQGRVEQFLAEIALGLDAAEQLAEAAADDDIAAAREAGREAQTATREAARRARELGAHSCAEQAQS